MNITQASAKGSRAYMEDFHNIIETPQGVYCAVWDGHGGDECSEYCATRFPQLLDGFHNLVEALRILNTEMRQMHAGTTASIVFLPEKHVFPDSVAHVAVLGDSPVVIKRANGTIWVSPEHNVRTNKAEADAAVARGGHISGGYLFSDAGDYAQGLQMSRALGDVSLDRVLLRSPDISMHVLNAGSWVLVCTDGAVDPSHNSGGGYGVAPTNPMDDVVRLVEDGADAQQIVDRALAAQTGDNVTAILVRL